MSDPALRSSFTALSSPRCHEFNSSVKSGVFLTLTEVGMSMTETVTEWIANAPVGTYIAFDENGGSTVVEITNDFLGVDTVDMNGHKVVLVGRGDDNL